MLQLLTNPTGLLSGLAGLVALLFGVWMHGRGKGKAAIKNQVERERRKARTEAEKIDDAVAGRTADENRARLKQRWSKP